MPSDMNNPHPSWIQSLLRETAAIDFLADDQELLCSVVCESTLSDTEYLNIPDLEDEDDFAVELGKLINQHWYGTKRQLCADALLLENTFYKIQSGRRQPGRDTIICLALTLQLNLDETQHLLGYLGYGLSDNIKRDYIIRRCLEQKRKPLEVNLVLESSCLRLLGTEN